MKIQKTVRMRLENEVLLEKRRHEQEHELAEMKTDFFTTLSHELRTPLTLISRYFSAKVFSPYFVLSICSLSLHRT